MPAWNESSDESSSGDEDGFDEVGHPLLKGEPADMLNPDIDGVDYAKQLLTPRRIVVFAIAAILGLVLVFTVHPSSFASTVKQDGVMDTAGCLARCAENSGSHNMCAGHTSFEIEFCNEEGDCKEQESPGYMRTPKCSYMVAPEKWEVKTVLVTLIFGILLIVEGIDSEIIMVGLSCLYAATGIISGTQAFMGFSNGGVIGLAMLFPIAHAIEETGMLEVVVAKFLGSPSNFYVALFRMMFPVAVLSAFLSNTAIVAMMIPIIVSWARRLDVSPGKMMMPLSFSAQLGGTMTLIGSSICLVAKQAVPANIYDMQFFDLFPVGFALLLVTMVFIVICLPCLKSSNMKDEIKEEAPTEHTKGKMDEKNWYNISLLVKGGFNYDGKKASEVTMQLERMPGVHEVKAKNGPDSTLKMGSELVAKAKDNGIVALRHVKDLQLQNEGELRLLGRKREQRHLYEVLVQPDSSLIGHPPHSDAMRQALGCTVVAMRGKELGSAVQVDDVLMVEADSTFVGGKEWLKEFYITREVANSSPPRVGLHLDHYRNILVVLGMAVLVVLVTLDMTKLSYGGGCYVAFLLMINAISLKGIYRTLNLGVLLTIAGAFGVSEALQKTGIAGFTGTQVTNLTIGGGVHCVRAAVYFVAMFFSMFMNNSATVAIMGPMAVGIAEQLVDQDDSTTVPAQVKALLFVIVYGAGTCLMTPLGYQTNMMVMEEGGYVFGDFTKYGAPVQVMHLIATVLLVWLLVDICGL